MMLPEEVWAAAVPARPRARAKAADRSMLRLFLRDSLVLVLEAGENARHEQDARVPKGTRTLG
jgi:hypothetical protein